MALQGEEQSQLQVELCGDYKENKRDNISGVDGEVVSPHGVDMLVQ